MCINNTVIIYMHVILYKPFILLGCLHIQYLSSGIVIIPSTFVFTNHTRITTDQYPTILLIPFQLLMKFIIRINDYTLILGTSHTIFWVNSLLNLSPSKHWSCIRFGATSSLPTPITILKLYVHIKKYIIKHSHSKVYN